MWTVSHALAEAVGVVAGILWRRPDRHPATFATLVGTAHLAPAVALGRRHNRPSMLLGELQRLFDVLLRVPRSWIHRPTGSWVKVRRVPSLPRFEPASPSLRCRRRERSRHVPNVCRRSRWCTSRSTPTPRLATRFRAMWT